MEKSGYNKRHYSSPEKRCLLGATILFGGSLFLGAAYLGLLSDQISPGGGSLFCKYSMPGFFTSKNTRVSNVMLQLNAIVHYATSHVVPQQSLSEIQISFDVLKSLSPCNFLVFGLGHDSLMWASLNPGGTTLFLEEDPKWVDKVLKDAPYLRAHTVVYRTQLSEADDLLNHYRTQPEYCSARKSFIRGNDKCKLALNMLPDEVYDREWDLIMIDAPRGYFAEAPGRMAAIYSAAVMARNRNGSSSGSVTHVFLHDVDRKVEKIYAETFLCRKYRVNSVGRLWHFQIPAATAADSNPHFC